MWPTEVQGAWAAALPAARHSAWHPPQRGKKRMLFLGYAWRDSYHRGRSMIFFDMGGGDTRFCVGFSCWCLRVLDPFTISRIFDNRRRRVVALRRRPSVRRLRTVRAPRATTPTTRLRSTRSTRATVNFLAWPRANSGIAEELPSAGNIVSSALPDAFRDCSSKGHTLIGRTQT
jgi:hypothetical protein